MVKNTGLIALTPRRLVFGTLTGHLIEVPVESIIGVRERVSGWVADWILITATAAGEMASALRYRRRMDTSTLDDQRPNGWLNTGRALSPTSAVLIAPLREHGLPNRRITVEEVPVE